MLKTAFNLYSESVIDTLSNEVTNLFKLIRSFSQNYQNETSFVRRKEENFLKQYEFLLTKKKDRVKSVNRISVKRTSYFELPARTESLSQYYPLEGPGDERDDKLNLISAAASSGALLPNGINGRLNNSQLKNVGGGFKLWAPAANSYLAMKVDAERDGIYFELFSAYRTYDEQQQIVKDRGLWSPTNPGAAPPGQSIHGLGAAIDIGPEAAQEWIRVNGKKYGWVPTVPNEPWHFEYVGGGGSTTVEPQKESSKPITQKISAESNFQPIFLVSQSPNPIYDLNQSSNKTSQSADLNNRINMALMLQMHSTYGIG